MYSNVMYTKCIPGAKLALRIQKIWVEISYITLILVYNKIELPCITKENISVDRLTAVPLTVQPNNVLKLVIVATGKYLKKNINFRTP